MDQNPNQIYVQQPLKPSNRKKYAYGVLYAVVLIGAVAGTYVWQHGIAEDLEARNSNKTVQTTAPINNDADRAVELEMDVSDGFPLSMKGKKVLTTMYVPGGMSLLPSTAGLGNRTQEDLKRHFTESYNDLIGMWAFDHRGTVEKPSSNLQAPNIIFMSVMSGWQSTADTSEVAYPRLDGGVDFRTMTVAQKADYIDQLKLDTDQCASDTSKGFTTNDKTYNVCYTLLSPKAQGGSWILNLAGYGTIEKQPTYFGGNVTLSDDAEATRAPYIDAFKNITTKVVVNELAQ